MKHPANNPILCTEGDSGVAVAAIIYCFKILKTNAKLICNFPLTRIASRRELFRGRCSEGHDGQNAKPGLDPLSLCQEDFYWKITPCC